MRAVLAPSMRAAERALQGGQRAGLAQGRPLPVAASTRTYQVWTVSNSMHAAAGPAAEPGSTVGACRRRRARCMRPRYRWGARRAQRPPRPAPRPAPAPPPAPGRAGAVRRPPACSRRRRRAGRPRRRWRLRAAPAEPAGTARRPGRRRRRRSRRAGPPTRPAHAWHKRWRAL